MLWTQKPRTKKLHTSISKIWITTESTHISGWNTGNNWILYINENVYRMNQLSKKDLETAKNLNAASSLTQTSEIRNHCSYKYFENQFRVRSLWYCGSDEVPKMKLVKRGEKILTKITQRNAKTMRQFTCF